MIEALLRARPPRHRVRVDAGDDAAVLLDGTVVTVDAMLEGVHFTRDADPTDLGAKLLAVSVSDVAAMGARPGAAVLTLALPRVDAAWLEAFARGMADACATYDVELVGGDTTRSSGGIALSLTLLGRCVATPWLRSGGRPGQGLWVTGTLGDAGAGWMLRDPWPSARRALARPDPPLAFALAAAEAGLVSAAMDLSDGLATDLPRLCAASGCGAEVDPAALPASAAVASHPERLALQTCGGEDYQLLMAVDRAAEARLAEVARQHATRLTRIGTLDRGAVRLQGTPWPQRAFEHFASGAP